jgi:hypothetical protein
MQYFCTMLATKGRDLELNLLCGPYYRDLLKCYRVCARENELLSPSFFERYSCFTVYGEPGHYMVRLNPVAKGEDHMTEQSHVTQLAPASSSASAVPPDSSKVGDEKDTIRRGGKEKISIAANRQHKQQPAMDASKQSKDPIPKMKESTASSRGLVDPDIVQIIHDVLNKMFELIGECPETKEPLSSVLKKSTVTVADAETTETPVSSKGDRPKTSGPDPEKDTIEPPHLSPGENWDEESEEVHSQLPPPIVSADSVQVPEAPAPMATAEGSAKEKLDVDEKIEEASTEPLTVSADTELEAISLPGGDAQDDAAGDMPRTVTGEDGEMEVEEKQPDAPVISSSSVPEATQLLTEPSTKEGGDAMEEPVTEGDEIEDQQLLGSIDPLCAATVARVSESSSKVEDGDTIIEPSTGGDEGEEKQPQIPDIPLSLAAEVVQPIESTAEDWDSISILEAEGEKVENKPVSVGETSTVEEWANTVQPVTGEEEAEKNSISVGETSTLEDWADAIEITGEEEVEKNDIPVSLKAEVSESEDWGATVHVEPVTGEGQEQEGEETQTLFFVTSAPETAHMHTEEPPSKEDQDTITGTVTIEEKTATVKEIVEDQSTNPEIVQLTEPQLSTEEDWGAETEQLPLPLAAAADKRTRTSREMTPASSVVTYDEECRVESEQQIASCQGQSAPEEVTSSQSQFESEGPKEQTPAVIFDEDCWQESVSPECISIRSVECKPLRILKREESCEGDEPIGAQWFERKPLPPAHRRGGATRDGDGGGGGKKSKKKRKKKGKWGREGDDRHVRFSPAPRDEAKSTSGRSGKQSSSSKHKENKGQSSASSRDKERPSSSSKDYRGQSFSSRDSYRGREHRQHSSEGKQRFTRERDDVDDRVSDSSQTSKEESSRRGIGGEGGYRGGDGGGRRRDTREFYERRHWCMGPTGRWYEYGAGWRQDKKLDQNTESAK